MTRKRIGPLSYAATVHQELAERLASEISHSRECGQPFIYEQEYRTGKLRVNVVWDAWRRVPLPERTATIMRAYELAEGAEARNRIALASGLTVPEAHEAGMLPYEIIAALRKGDPLQWFDAANALKAEGGSRLFHPLEVKLLVATQEEAEASRKRLIERFPGTEEVWLINREIVPSDYAPSEDVAEGED
jgi:hypothetical protein